MAHLLDPLQVKVGAHALEHHVEDLDTGLVPLGYRVPVHHFDASDDLFLGEVAALDDLVAALEGRQLLVHERGNPAQDLPRVMVGLRLPARQELFPPRLQECVEHGAEKERKGREREGCVRRRGFESAWHQNFGAHLHHTPARAGSLVTAPVFFARE